MKDVLKLLEEASQLLDEAHELTEAASDKDSVLSQVRQIRQRLPVERAAYLKWLLSLAQLMGIAGTVSAERFDGYSTYVCRIVINQTESNFFARKRLRDGEWETEISFGVDADAFIKCLSTMDNSYDIDSHLLSFYLFPELCNKLTVKMKGVIKDWVSRADQFRFFLSCF
ncbi:MAG: hypothetical protein WCI76_00790 [bacterium]